MGESEQSAMTCSEKNDYESNSPAIANSVASSQYTDANICFSPTPDGDPVRGEPLNANVESKPSTGMDDKKEMATILSTTNEPKSGSKSKAAGKAFNKVAVKSFAFLRARFFSLID